MRERKRKELEGFARCDAMLAYRTKAFKKTKEHAAQNHDSLRKRADGLRSYLEPSQSVRAHRCVRALTVCVRWSAGTDAQHCVHTKNFRTPSLFVLRWILWIKQLKNLLGKKKKKQKVYLKCQYEWLWGTLVPYFLVRWTGDMCAVSRHASRSSMVPKCPLLVYN